MTHVPHTNPDSPFSRSFARAAADLQHLSALVSGDTAPPAPPAAPVPTPAPVRRPGSNKVPAYTFEGRPTFIAELAAMAGCARGAMQQRLHSGLTPEQAVAGGERMTRADRQRMRGDKPRPPAAEEMLASAPTPSPTSAPAAPAPTSAPVAAARPALDPRRMFPRAATPAPALLQPKASSFNPDMTTRQVLAKDAEAITPDNVKRTVATPAPSRYAPDPGHVGLFSQLGPGRYVR